MHSKYLMFIILSLMLVCFPETAHAQALFDSGTNFLNALVNLLTNTWARLIAVLAVMILGILWAAGRLSMRTTLSVIGGIILLFGAPAIVDGIAGSL